MSKQSTPYVFNNRELSWLNFNKRVLEEALDAGNPLLERLKFLAIVSSNLDEFFMVRVGGLQQLVLQGKVAADNSGWAPADLLRELSVRAHAMVERQYRCFMEEIKTGLHDAGIRRLHMNKLTPALYEYLEGVFEHELYPVITPIALRDPADLPQLPGLNIMLLVRLKPDEGKSKKPRYAVVLIPKRLGRFITAPIEEGHNYVLVEDVVGEFINRLFPGEPVAEVVPFRITRNADMSVREDLAGDLLSRMKDILVARKQSSCVRLEVSASASKTSLAMLSQMLSVNPEHIYPVPGPLDLAAYFGLARMTGFDDLREKPWPPQQPPAVPPNTSIFEAIARKDIILHHPYESFDPVVRLVEQAADDPNVLAIKQILYRTSENSPIIAALARAANRDKHVTAIVELKARFDEARNIGWAEALEQSGVQVIYGIKGLKTHAKICVVVRKEAGGIRRYVHFGTGNYNEITARLYTDTSYMTCHDDYGADATAFFNMISGYSQPVSFRKLEAAPIGLRSRLLQLIESETLRSKEGQPARIMARVNALVDPDIIQALYRASQAGVNIQLNVRGICGLRPGVPGQSENIEVISIVDRFLEHSRILYFHQGGEPLLFISSADWMPRNLDRRVELLIPIDDDEARQRLIQTLETAFRDNVKARRQKNDGTYERVKPARGAKLFRSQELFYQQACAATQQARTNQPLTFQPERPSLIKP
ncbi:MAG TPA: polyphosphate kinase 1 [Kiritimatiellia bacterium]|nr:polyphosphate kinase 1 [Kiritimatiellia bacterium]HMO97570.1 polyphosphate kinase 1 [Kiritimatiellia bacterium]HMP95944.1 polyphosphate kinase 1 [Kiritimatiellia bacterium]